MRFAILLMSILSFHLPALADDLLIVQSVRDRAGAELQRSVTRAVTARTETLVLGDYAETDLPRVVREEQPDVILAIGEAAYRGTSKIRGVPVVAITSLPTGTNRNIPANVTGIDIRIDPARYMTIFKALGLKRIGVEYDPARSGGYLARAQQAAAQAGIELALRPARSSKDALKELKSLKGSVCDGLWLIPDSTTGAPVNLEADFLFSLEQTKPVISYTEEHLHRGAAIALSPEWTRVGQQAGGIIRRLLDGAAPREIPVQSPQNFSLRSNDSVLTNLGISAGKRDKLFSKTK